MILVLPEALLVLSFVFIRPVCGRDWRRRLALHTALLAACLVATLVERRGLLPLGGLAAALVQLAIIAALDGPDRDGSTPGVESTRPPAGWSGVGWLGAGLALVALLIAVMPDTRAPHGLLTLVACMGLIGLLAAVAAGDATGRIGGLVLAGNALILAGSDLPGPDGLMLGVLLAVQAGLLGALWHRVRVPDPVPVS